jgi:hypothetical protein
MKTFASGSTAPLELDHLAAEGVDPFRSVRIAVEDLHLDLVDVVLQPSSTGP